jgi:ribosomal protein S12 methylthiotransferase
MLSKAGFKAYHQTNEPTDIAIINTCGFIGDAKEESINTILEFCQAKKDGKLKELYVMGCLSERYREDLQSEIPEVDRFYGKFDWTSLVNNLQPAASSAAQEGEASASPARTTVAEAEAEANPADSRQITTPRHYAYIKISEGCNRFCAFCAIPLITGRHHSRPIEEIEQEVSELVAEGVKEFNIIAQDLSSYGLDLYGKHELAQLIDRLADIKGVERIRLHYAYPADFPMDILDVMARRKNVCKYLDIALQHISDRVLTNMRRHITGDETRQLLAEIRKRVPGIHIRTTLMVGFPGEEEQDFEELMEFVKEQRFERMGAFAYCEEEGTYGANNFEDNIPEEVKQERLNKLMALQEEISLDIQQSKQGRILDVIIDSEEDEYYIGRTEFDSPEVDPEVMVKKTVTLKPGDIIPVKIEQALPFELIGSPA